MKLDPLGQDILRVLNLNPALPLRSVARALKVTENTIHRRLLTLQDEGVIKTVCVVDTRPLGFQEYSLWFGGEGAARINRTDLFKRISSHPRLIAINNLGSDFELVICALNPQDLELVLCELTNQAVGLPGERSLSIWIRWRFLQRIWRGTRSENQQTISNCSERKHVAIDELDHSLLQNISRSTERLTAAHLARATHTPEKTVQYRLARFRECGIVRGEILLIDSSKVEMQLMRLAISLHGHGDSTRQKVLACLLRHPRVLSIVESLGHWDLEAFLDVPLGEDIDGFLNLIKCEAQQNLSSISLLPVISRPKFSPYPFQAFSDLQQTQATPLARAANMSGR